MKIESLIANFSTQDIAELEYKFINNAKHDWGSEKNKYMKDWSDLSYMVKEARNYTCEKCGYIANSSMKKYIHTHYKSSIDKSRLDLEVLCVKCHYEKKHRTYEFDVEYKRFIQLTSTDQMNFNTVTVGKLMIQDSSLPKKMNWSSACRYCDMLSLFGFMDWKVPTLKELEIAYAKKYKFKNIADSYYWSIEKESSRSLYSGVLDFTNGESGEAHQSCSWHVRCVRTNY